MSEFDSDTPRTPRSDDEMDVARVLRAAGERARPSDEMKSAVRAAVHAEWRATVAQRSQRRMWLALAASVAVATLAVWIGRAYLGGRGEIVASVGRAVGTAQSRGGSLGGWHTLAAAGAPSKAAPQSLHVGEDLMTGHDGLVALRMRDGVSLRLDRDTHIVFVGPERVDVQSGAVYVDAGLTHDSAEHLRVGTPAGVIEHLGTQYEARIVSGGTRIRVREGRVALTPPNGDVQRASVGEQLLVSASGEIRRGTIAPGDASWNWAEEAAPALDIDGRSVREFLTWVGREVGREIVFATPETEEEADRAVLSGSIAGLSPSEALAAVLPTTQLRSIERDGRIEIVLQKTP